MTANDEDADGKSTRDGDGSQDTGSPTGRDENGGDLRVQEVDRIFSILESAVQREEIDIEQTNQLLRLLEQVVASPAGTDPDAIAELVSMLEELILQPDDLSEANIEGTLSVFEQAITGLTNDPERAEDVLSVVEAAVRDPAGVSPKDVERFRSGIEEALLGFTDPDTGGLGQLFGASGSPVEDAEALEDEQLDLFRLACLGAGMTQRATGYSVESGLRTGTRMAYAAMNANSPAELLTETRALTLDELRRSGVNIGEQQQEWLTAHEDAIEQRPVTGEQLRERGERLLSQSAEIGREEPFHPAYPSILDELATDEARILRLLATEGMQASVDVYDKQYIPFTSRLVAQNLSMVGNDAGCRDKERTPIYLQNLDRLGLVRFADEPVENLKRYQVLDAQPHIEAAMENAKRPKTVYGSIQLTEFGIDFCEACLPVTVKHRKQRRRFRGEPPDSDDSE